MMPLYLTTETEIAFLCCLFSCQQETFWGKKNVESMFLFRYNQIEEFFFHSEKKSFLL